MFNRSDIMKRAWAGYREMAREMRETSFNRQRFASELRFAWAFAKRTAAQAERAARDAVPCPVPEHETVQSPRAIEIRTEMEAMNYRERMDWNRRRELAAELDGLAA